jgi:hypothetical protein
MFTTTVVDGAISSVKVGTPPSAASLTYGQFAGFGRVVDVDASHAKTAFDSLSAGLPSTMVV